MFRLIAVTLALTALVGCGGSDGPAAPAVPPVVTAIAAVRAVSPTWQRDSLTFTAQNVGRAAQWRVSAWGDGNPCPIGTPNNSGCDPVAFCTGTGALIGASAQIRLTVACGSRYLFQWVVIETQDPGSPAWQRTACVARVASCPAVILPQR